ncbi:MAG: YIP1 family protein [Anaerolineales bacterium]|nr:YIP1 family protein [Anaerolineales bacterium]
MDTNSLINRLMRVIRFDTSVYREIAADPNALSQALIIVVASVIISSLGSISSAMQISSDVIVIASFFISSIIGGLIGFVLFSLLAAVIAKNLFQGKTDFREMARTLGFTYIFQTIGVLGLIPCLGALIALVGTIVTIVAAVIALRESAEFDTTKAVITAVVAGLAVLAINACIGFMLGSLLAAIGLVGA